METKILNSDGKLARICIVQADGQDGPQLDLALFTGTKGKGDDFDYWAFKYGDAANHDLSDFIDWLTELKTQGAIDCEVNDWIRDAISYRLNNGPFKSAQKESQKINGKSVKVDSLSPEAKLEAIREQLAGDAFKLRTPGESKTTLKTKLSASEDKGKRMGEIYAERRDIETKAKTAKGKDLDKLTAQLDKLDNEFIALNA
jgi:hypothetical protein